MKDLSQGRGRMRGGKLETARRLFLRNRLLESQIVLNGLLRREPQNYAANLLMGNILSDLGRLKDALIRFDRALAIEPMNPEGHELKANALLGEGCLKEAERCARSALKLAIKLGPDEYPALDLIYDILVNSLIEQKRFRSAEKVALEGIRVTKSDILRCHLDRIRRCLTSTKKGR